MLTRPLTLNDSDGRGCGLVAVTPHPDLPLADESDGDNDTETGVFSPPVPPWSFSSSASAPLPFSSSFSSCPGPTPPSCLSFPSLTAPVRPLSSPSFYSHGSLLSSPSSLCPPQVPPLSSASSTCPAPPPVVFTPLTTSLFAPLSSSHPVFPSLHSSAPSLSSACSPPPPPSPPQVFTPLSRHDSPSLASAPSLIYHCSPLISPPLAQTSVLYPPSSSPSIPLCLSSQRPTTSSPSTLPPTPPHFCSCSCSSLLPRILSAHRLEVRRLLQGALASLGRRLDSLERRRRRRRKRTTQGVERGGSACSPGLAAVPLIPASSCSPTLLPPVTTGSSSASSSDAKDSHTPPLPSNLSQSEHRSRRGEEEGWIRGRKRRRNNHRGREMNEKGEDPDEVEAAGRFVGRMVVSIRRGAEEEEAPLTLHNFNYKQHRGGGAGSSQPEKVVTLNGFKAPLYSTSSSSSQNALHLLQSAQICSQSEAPSISSGQWHFADLTTPLTHSSNHRALHLWLCSSSSSAFSSAPMLRFSAIAMAMMSEAVRGGASWRPLRCLKDRTAPHSLSSDHCYVRTAAPSPAFSARRQQKQQADHGSRCRCIPWLRTLPLPSSSANGLSALLPAGQSAAGSELLSTDVERGKRVSQIRIRRASPRETSLTPMGLPKVKRLKKKEFSLEEIYTNKNYRSPSSNRSLETIFEEPREKDGALLLIGQQKRRRLLLFPDFTQPRKRKRPQGAGLPVAIVPRKRAAARRHYHGDSPNDDESDLDVMLVERLSALEDFMTRQGLDV